ncbi:MAG TPA: hypothetical protein RMH99_33200 [Sandaracinaceae bacterium LLY-WYZ-13_1]|nr:hypothetical protein [Sandaracinaceae bacterium LLY-WYZ-13_1]
MSLSLALLASPASAQRGAAGALDDPSGRAPGARSTPDADASGPAPSRSVTTDPDYADAVEVPEPPGVPVVGGDDAGGVAPTVRERLRLLDSTWQVLANTGGPAWFDGIAGIVGGGISIALGAILLELDPGGSGERLAPYLITLGSTAVVRAALVDLILPPNPRPTAIRYANMPDATPEQARERLAYGERELEALAEYSMILRILDGGLSIAGALAVVPAYLAPNDWTISELEALIFLGPALSLVFGIITLASPSPAERRWDAYREMRDREGEPRAEADPGITWHAGFAIDPRNGGRGSATLTGRF